MAEMKTFSSTMDDLNFIILDLTVSLMIFVSALYGDRLYRRNNGMSRTTKNIIIIPDSLFNDFGSENEDPGKSVTKNNEQEHHRESQDHISNNNDKKYIIYFVGTLVIYFMLMTYAVVLSQKKPEVMLVFQHVAIIGFIFVAFKQLMPSTIANGLGLLLSLVWFLSSKTSYRWIINDFIVFLCSLMAGHIRFKNFTCLQAFLWGAFIYDVFLLARLQLKEIRLFSANISCQNLLCELLHYNNNYDLPTVFAVRLGHHQTHVYLGTGDIVIGSLVANFASSFFRSRRCMAVIVIFYATSVGLLIHVRGFPFPALCTIVPLCTMGLVLCALFSRKVHTLFAANKMTAYGQYNYKAKDDISVEIGCLPDIPIKVEQC